MALLRSTWRRAPARIVGLLTLCFMAGCMLMNGGEAKAKFAFSHKKHVAEQGLECINCHADAGRSDQPGMPTPDACSVCHDEIDAQKPPEKQVAALFAGETFKAAHATALSNELTFSHQRHTAAMKDCGLCHAGLESNERISADVRFTMDTCTDCHASRNVASVCSTCHREVRAETPPESHHHDWKHLHGRCARSPSDATADRCALCHSESTCVQCHREEAPRNHNVYWHERGHGIAAMLDRSNCAVCHTEDSCVSCHTESPPRNHMGQWSLRRQTHCISCHFPLRTEGCVACHTNTNGHNEAPPKPTDPFHVRGMNCRQCHGLSAQLTHVDNGDDCNACHH